jgi:hypothetical protein
MLASFKGIFRTSEVRKTIQKCFGLSLKAVLDISGVPDAHFPSMKQNLIQMHCSFN